MEQNINLEDITLGDIIANYIQNYNLNYDEIIAELSDAVRVIIDNNYLEEY